jgi:hypothetical protein
MKTIKNLTGYAINESNEIVNEKTGKTIKESNGSVRLVVDGKRKSFKVATLLEEAGVIDKVKATGKGWSRTKKAEATKEKSEAPAKSSKKKIVIKKPVVSNTEKVSKIKKETAKAEKKSKAKDKEKLSPAELIKAGIYPYKIKDEKEIIAKIETLEIGDAVSFIDYQTKRKKTATIVGHSKFSDHYPAARIKVGEGKKATRKLISYLSLTKK